ncbi:hypothetical protein PUR29_03645 [Methylobacterium ajmalii]|uniref:DUF3617 family protein n=1 Tax=Methylobacterium ajmalii TaxID=2738439 RepID=A0ABU9ZNV4_9HYPH
MRFLILSLAASLISSAAIAQNSVDRKPYYVGIWSPSAKLCKADPLKIEGAIFRIERSQIIWNETTCKFKLSAARTNVNGTSIPAICEAEGETSRTTYVFDMIDGRMRMNGRVMVRCKDSDWRTGYE